MTDGIRTRDIKDHNLALYQLSYSHHLAPPPDPNAAKGTHPSFTNAASSVNLTDCRAEHVFLCHDRCGMDRRSKQPEST